MGGVEHETFILFFHLLCWYHSPTLIIFFLTFQHQQPAKEVFLYSDIMFKRLEFFIAFKKLLMVFSPKKV